MVANPKMLGHFIFNSDYPVDKIVWLKEGQTTTPSSVTNKYVNFNMADYFNSTLAIFVKGAYTLDNWANAYMIGSRRAATVSPDMYVNTWLHWNDTVLELTIGASNSQGTSKTLKYRLWGVVRDDVQEAVDYPKNATTGKAKLVFNTELNYPRLYKDGVARGGDTITHNLGKIPYIDYWTASSRSFAHYWSYWPTGGFGNAYTGQGIRATDSTITFGGANTTYYYYRIYA